MFYILRVRPLLLLTLLAVACTPKGGPADTAPESDDSGPDDSAPDDSGSDDSGPDDSGPDDSGPDDSAPDDSGSDDTAPDDTAPDDTAPDDTAVDSDGDGYTGDGGDCDDTNVDVHPGAAERCNTVDDDCDGAVDEDDAVDAPTWYTDADGDGYGDDATAVTSCRTPRDRVAVGGDCADGDATVHPDATELCNAVDDDCDTSVDEGFDLDADGHLDEVACATLGGDDCDDTSAAVHPGAVEVCGNGADDDCDDTAIGCGLAGDRDYSDADATISGIAASDVAGRILFAPGDVDGDGYPDFIASAQMNDSGGTSAGAAYLVRGPFSGASTFASAYATFLGEAGNVLGPLSGGDFDGDGVVDVVVGLPGADGEVAGAGAACVFLGPLVGTRSAADADARYLGDADSGTAGYPVGSAGDTDGDGTDDVLVGDYTRSGAASLDGAVWLIRGPTAASMVVSAADAVIVGEGASDRFGTALGGPGDVDGDGLDDVLVGSTNDRAYLFTSPLAGTMSAADADVMLDGTGLGRSLASPGDTNGDGLPDLLVGAPSDGTGFGYLFAGPLAAALTPADAAATFVGTEVYGSAGRGMATCDTNGDGVLDFAIGADQENSAGAGTYSGTLYLALGPISGTIDLAAADGRFLGDPSLNQSAGYAVVCDDTDLDGFDDLLIGAPDLPTGAVGTGPGALYVVGGGPGL